MLGSEAPPSTCAQCTLLGDSPGDQEEAPKASMQILLQVPPVHAVSPSHGRRALWQPTTPCRPTRHVLHPGDSATVPRAASGLYGGRLHERAQLGPEGAAFASKMTALLGPCLAQHPVCAYGFHYGSSCMSPRLLSQGALLNQERRLRAQELPLPAQQELQEHYGGGAALLRSTVYSRTARLSTRALLPGAVSGAESADDSDRHVTAASSWTWRAHGSSTSSVCTLRRCVCS